MSNDLLRGHLYNEYKRYQRLYDNCDDTDARIWYLACMSTLDSLAFRFFGVQLVDVMNDEEIENDSEDGIFLGVQLVDVMNDEEIENDCDNHSSEEMCKK